MHLRTLLTCVFIIGTQPLAVGQIINTFAGNGTFGFSGDGGPATTAQLADPFGVATDNLGNVYIADNFNNRIRKVNNTGIITTIAGTGTLGYSGDGGPAISAALARPSNIAIDNNGNIYFVDQVGAVVRKISTSGVISTVCGSYTTGFSGDGGPVGLALFQSIAGLTFDAVGNLYISDWGNYRIRKVDLSGIITTVVGNGVGGIAGDGGPATSASIFQAQNVVFDGAGNMYFSQTANHLIRKVNTAGIISTYAGTGVAGYSGDGGAAISATFRYPWHMAIDNSDNLYISDSWNHVVRKITPLGIVSTLAGNGTYGYSGDGGPAINAQMAEPAGVATDNAGNVFIVDHMPFYVVRKVNTCNSALVSQQPSNFFICNFGNATFSISATGFNNLQWQVYDGSTWNDLTDNTTYSGTTSPTLNIVGAGAAMNNYMYRCAVINSCGPIYSTAASLIVATLATPAVSISATATSICQGTTVTFNAAYTNGGSAPVFQWRKNGVPVGSSNAAYVDNNLTQGDVISCILTSNRNCLATNNVISNAITMDVTTPLVPSITITSSANNICSGTPVTFTASAINEGNSPLYQWTKNGLQVGTNAMVYIDHSLNNGDVLRCSLTTSHTCVTTSSAVSNTISINVNPLNTPAITINSSAASICPGSTVTFTAMPLHEGTAPTYQWQKNGIPIGGSAPTYTDNNLKQGDLIACLLTSNATCLTSSVAASNSIAQNVFPSPVVVLDQTPTLCSGNTRILDAGKFESYLWNDGSNVRTLSIKNTGTYYVTVTDINNCTGSDTTIVSKILPKPADFLPQADSMCSYSTIQLSPFANYRSYLWNTNSSARSITVSKPGMYWLEVTDENSCKGKDTIEIFTKQCLEGFFIPNAFTPNNDRKNDYFRPILLGDVKAYMFSVYNRWGQLVFRSTDMSKGWDGNFSGTMQDSNVFVWVCSYQFAGKPVKVEKGNVVLIR